jgi:hypothetical protein
MGCVPVSSNVRPLNQMKAIHSVLGAAALVTASQVSAAVSAVLLTPQFVVVVVERCPEGDVACNDVTYTGVNRNTGESIHLKGQAWVRLCADRVTPCQHIGWQFKNGDLIYRVQETPAVLQVERRGKTLLEEAGKWAD